MQTRALLLIFAIPWKETALMNQPHSTSMATTDQGSPRPVREYLVPWARCYHAPLDWERLTKRNRRLLALARIIERSNPPTTMPGYYRSWRLWERSLGLIVGDSPSLCAHGAYRIAHEHLRRVYQRRALEVSP